MSKVEHVWHSLSSTQVLKKLNATKKGLSTKEVEKRLGKLGSNELAKAEKFSLWRLFIGQFKSALVYVLLVAGIISIFFGETIDVYVILAAVMLNVVVGFIQEYKANQSLEKLNEVVRKESLVIRDNNEQRVESRLLVPGDIIVLESGNRVPADAKLLSINDFEVNEATLTGESWPVKKSLDTLAVGTVLAERKNMVFMGTLVVEGRAQAVVTGTGFFTEMGKITVMLKETKEEKTPLQKKLDSFAKNITKFVGIVALGLFVLGIVQGHPWAEMFTVAVAVAVAAIPEGLVISMTMILTVGMQRILKNNGLVRRLISAETLGSTTVICTDKTGTLTEGEMRVTQIVTHKHRIDLAVGSSRDTEVDKELDMMSKISFLCNDSVVQNPEEFSDNWMIIGSPTEKALLLYGAKGVNAKSLNKEFPRLEEVPFDSQRKFMVTRHSFDDKRDIIFIKGAPEKMLNFSTSYLSGNKVIKLTKSANSYFQEQWESLSKSGLRVLAGGYRLVAKDFKEFNKCKENPQDFIFIGIWGLSDPLRPEAKATISQTLRAGIKTVIITGDNKFTAQKIARDLGISASNDSVVTGDELLKMTDKELDSRIQNIKVYARVTPADKLRIIKAWQNRGETVSMTGDGVNDAPALKAADIGVAVSSGSDVAKETADLVLLDNNFETIVMSIKQGRVIFSNIKKVILYLLSDSFSEVAIIVGSLLLGLPLPLLAAQILWVNLVNDGLPALALTMEPEDEEIMNKKLRARNKQLFDFESRFLTIVITFLSASTSLWIFWYFLQTTGNEDLARTATFTALGIDTLFYVFSIKSLDRNILKAKPFKNKYLNGAVIIGLGMQLVAIYVPFFNRALRTVPLTWGEWKVILFVIFVTITLIEVIKAIFIKYYKGKRR
ncbi:HAD-IC family P-type ATPase [Candidatus Parcubacteria bacterium]|jgi:P-type Ca2+ transporter type 2C|nr:HAD-IC family P-type ATPase [Candidatus Parcubacteria bacterium]